MSNINVLIAGAATGAAIAGFKWIKGLATSINKSFESISRSISAFSGGFFNSTNGNDGQGN